MCVQRSDIRLVCKVYTRQEYRGDEQAIRMRARIRRRATHARRSTVFKHNKVKQKLIKRAFYLVLPVSWGAATLSNCS